MIIETSSNKFYRVTETNKSGLDHVWYGFQVKRTKDEFVLTDAGNRAYLKNCPELVRKAASRVVEA